MSSVKNYPFIKNNEEITYVSEDERILVTEDDMYTTRYYKDGLLHRDGDKPALVGMFWTEYFKFGRLHRENGNPACIYTGFRQQEDCFYHGEKVSFVQARKIKQANKKGEKLIIPTSKRIVKKIKEINPTDNFSDINRKLLNRVVENTYIIEQFISEIEQSLHFLLQLAQGEIDNLYQYSVEHEDKEISITDKLLEQYNLADFYKNVDQVIQDVDQEHTVEEARRNLEKAQEYFKDFLKNIVQYAEYPLYAHTTSTVNQDLQLPESYQTEKIETQFYAFGYKANEDIKFGYNRDNQQLEITFLKHLDNGKKVIDKQKTSFYAAFSELMDDENLNSILDATELLILNLKNSIQNIEELTGIVQSSISDKIDFTRQQLGNLINNKEDELDDMKDATKALITKFL